MSDTDTMIGFLGAAHGDLTFASRQCARLQERGISSVYQLGDFGVRVNDGRLDLFSAELAERGQTLYFVDGDEDPLESLTRMPISSDGIRWIRPRIGHLPRGYRTTFPSGKTLAAFGGAGSLDRSYKRLRGTWSPLEMISEDDLANLGGDHADIMIGHNAPTGVPQLDRRIESTPNKWTDDDIEYAGYEQHVFSHAFSHVAPDLYLGGGRPFHVDQVVGFWDSDSRTAFACRVVLVDQAGGSEATTAILTPKTMALEFLDATGEAVASLPAEVTDLTTQHSGIWKVTTVGSEQIFNLDDFSWSRIPGAAAAYPEYAPVAWPLRSIEVCKVGRSGYWTMPGDYLVEYWWHRSSIVRSICPVNGKGDNHAGV